MKLSKSRIVTIVGPTAGGKSALAVQLARRFNGEIISADSRQVYKGMDLGTGKITKREMRSVPHHLLDVASPKRQYSVRRFQTQAQKAIRTIISHGKIPFIVGGTGFWLDVLIQGQQLPDVPPNLILRKQLARLTTSQLFAKLKTADPRRAKTIDSKNRRRLERALEIIIAQGTVSVISAKSQYNALWLGIRLTKDELQERIARRLAVRLRHGMIAEVRHLHAQGISWRRLDSFGLEYRYIARYLQGVITHQQMREQLLVAICQYAKRQMTWFKRNAQIHWIQNETQTVGLVSHFVNAQ